MRYAWPLLLACLVGGAAGAQTQAPTKLGPILAASSSTSSSILQLPAAANPATYISLRGGAMVSPRGAGLVGVDFSLPEVGLPNGWHGRVDADVIFKANLGGVDTLVPVTADLLSFRPGVPGANFYYGGGIGAVLGGKSHFDGKLVVGTELAHKLGAEVNVHFTNDTLVTLLIRLHL